MSGKNIFGVLNFLLCLINSGCATYWFVTSANYISNVDGIAIHLSILTTCITFVTILLAIAGVIGYNTIKSSCEEIVSNKAEAKAIEMANQILADFVSQASVNNNLTNGPTNLNHNITPTASGTVTGETI